jgi:hypothetical protein
MDQSKQTMAYSLQGLDEQFIGTTFTLQLVLYQLFSSGGHADEGMRITGKVFTLHIQVTIPRYSLKILRYF